MKTTFPKLTLLLILFTSMLFSQNKINPGVKTEYPEYKTCFSTLIDHKQHDFQQQLLQAKTSGNVNEVIRLQNELDKFTGSVSMQMQNDPNVQLIRASNPPFKETDNTINVIRILQRNNVKSIATATEQRGTTAGRIWIAATVAGAGNINDTLWVFYSDNNGFSWIGGGGFIYGGSSYITDELDMEIIENTSGTKYVWVIGSRIQSSQRHVTCFIVSSTFNISSFDLSFPNSAPSDVYYRPRITSDNSFFTSNPWIYIAVCKDSVEGPNIFRNTERTAVCLSPFTNTPTISYKPTQYGFSGTAPYPYRNHCDIAYYRNTGDTVIILKTGIYSDSTKEYFQKSDINGPYNSQIIGTGGNIQGTTRWKFQGRIASSGSYPNLMIVCAEQYTTSDWDIPYFSSTNGGASWSTGYLDYTTTFSTGPEIVGRRNTSGKFYGAFTNLNSTPNFHNIVICTAADNTWGSLVQPINHLSGAPALINAGPQPGIRFVNTDSCFTVWTENSYNNVWASNGCTPPHVTEILGNQIPQKYFLLQNYPNPFNPNTRISFGLLKASFVKLTVYNVLGEVAAILMNEQKQAGIYDINFNASNLSSGVYLYKLETENFTDVKKMLLIK